MDCNDDKWYSMLRTGPLVVYVDAGSSKIQHYILGVFDLNDCSSPNHAVIAKGWDLTWLTSTEYISLRNSWGLNWGEFGNFRVAYKPSKNKSCFITSFGLLPIA